MERLTKRCGDTVLIADCIDGNHDACEVIDILAAKLAAYEDTELSPEKIHGILLDFTIAKVEAIITIEGTTLRRLEELAQADNAGRVLEYVPGDTVYDRFGMAWTVTSSEIHKFKDGPLRYLYRCGHPGTDDYCALYSEEICQKPEDKADVCVCCGEYVPEGRQVCQPCETEAGL